MLNKRSLGFFSLPLGISVLFSDGLSCFIKYLYCPIGVHTSGKMLACKENFRKWILPLIFKINMRL
jgi:hypothetical protein